MNDEINQAELYTVTDPEGRVWTLRPIPPHVYIMFGQLPDSLTKKAIEASKTGDAETLEKELMQELTATEITNMLFFTRHALDFAVIRPRITLEASGPDEISPFKISKTVFDFLSAVIVMGVQNGGGIAAGLNSFRGRPGAPAANSIDGKELRAAAKRASRHKGKNSGA